MNSHPSSTSTGSRLDIARGVDMMGSQAALCKILVTVLASMSADVPAIEAALHAGEVANANRLLHAIKGYMPIFGSDALVSQVTAVEKLSKTESAAVVLVQYQTLAPELRQLLADIEGFLKTAL